MRVLLTVVLLLPSILSSQQKPDSSARNLGFEMFDAVKNLPLGATRWGNGYSISADSLVKRSGKYSLRIEHDPNQQSRTFGSSALSYPGSYDARTIELRGYMKFENVDSGEVGLLLRVDGEGRTLAFDNMQRRNIRGTSDWTSYSIVLQYPSNARAIVAGALLTGKGKLWVDDLQILLDDRDISEARPRIPSKAELDHAFDSSSGINSIDLSGRRIGDMTLLGKVWGFLKYHHPAVAKGDYNWDYELFRMLPEYLRSPSEHERDQLLVAWIKRYGLVEGGTGSVIDSPNVKLWPDLAWISELPAGSELAASLTMIRNAPRPSRQFYIEMAERVGNPMFINENQYSKLRPPDVGFRLLALYRYWNMIQYFFPYKNLAGDWNAVLSQFIPKFANATTDLEYKLIVLELIASIHDTHAGVHMDATIENWRGIYFAPIGLQFVEGKPTVVEYTNDELGAKSGLKIGDVILSVDGSPVSEIVERRLRFTSASNQPRKLLNLARDLLRSPDSLLAVRYERGAKTFHKDVRCFKRTDSPPVFTDVRKNRDAWKILPDNIGYIYAGNIKNDNLSAIMAALGHTRGLIIDLRTYPSDFITYTLSEYILPEPADFVKFTGGSVEHPGLFTYRPGAKVGRTHPDYYDGPVAILVNEVTLSNAEFTAMAYQTAPTAKVIGSTTAGADGNVSGIVLPGGVHTSISGIGVYYPDGKETQRVGIIPDITVTPTVEGIRQGRDEVLEQAIRWIKSGR